MPSLPADRWPESTRPSDFQGSLLEGTLLGGLPAARLEAASHTLLLDVCHVGVVLRAVVLVHAVMAVGVLFAAGSLAAWLGLVAEGSVIALPSVLLWLVTACLLKLHVGRLPLPAQWLSAAALGAASGVFGWMLGAFAGVVSFDGVRWMAAALAGAGTALTVVQWLTLRAKAKVPADTTAQLAELQSRIRPHFLFNTLNAALSLVRLDPVRAEGVLEDLAELFRVALVDNGESVPLADEVALAQRYLAIEQLRFGDRLEVSWEIDPAAGAARLPPLLLQPLVENAVRHGVEPAPHGGVIRVRTRVKKGRAVISIANSVSASPSLPGNGIALRNVRERLRLMHDVAAQFETRLDGDVFRVQIVLPL